jgi:hypothetical protein
MSPQDFFTQDDNVSRLLIEQAGSVADAIVKVFKCGGPSAAGGRGAAMTIRDVWLYQCQPHEFDEELLQSGYGPGKYRIRMYGTNAEGQYGSLLNKVLEVGTVPPWQRANAEARLNGNGSGSVTVNAQGGEMAKAMADALAPLIGAVATMMQHGQGNSRKEVLEEMRAMADIMRPAQPPDPLGNLSGLTKIMELAKSFAGNGDAGGLTEESGPYAVLMKALETFGGMLQAAREQGTHPALPAPATAAPAQPQPSPAAQPAAQPAANAENEHMETFLKMQLALFLNAAKAEGNPEIYAGLIVENAPEKLLDLMEAPTWFEELVKLAPDFAAHKAWCEQVRNIALEALKETAESEDAPEKPADLPKAPEASKSS